MHDTTKAAALALVAAAGIAACGRAPQEPPASSAVPAAPAAEEKVLNVYNWSDYIDPAVIERFTQETGIEVRYDVFDWRETESAGNALSTTSEPPEGKTAWGRRRS